MESSGRASGRSGRGNRLVWISEDAATFETIEESLRREGYDPAHRARPETAARRDGVAVVVLEAEDPADALALVRRIRPRGDAAPPILILLRQGRAGLLGAALRRGTLDVVVGESPDADLVLARLDFLRRSRNEMREVGVLRREMTRRLRQLRMIHRVGKTLAFALDPDDLVRTAAGGLREVFRYPKTAIFLRDESSGDLVLRARSGHPEDSTPLGMRLSLGRGLVGAAVASREIVDVPDVTQDERYVAVPGSGTRSELVVPIRAGGIVHGVVDLQSDQPAAFDAADREAVETLADEIGAGLANARLYAELRGRSEEIEDAYRRLRESDRLKDEFLSSISHELRTPLTSIRSFSEILLGASEEEPATVAEFMQIIHAESLRLTRLVDNLLDISRMDSGRMTWKIVETDPAAVLRRAVRAASSLASEKNVPIALDLPDEGLPRVRLDEDRVIQVLLNLLANAVKFSGDGSPVVVSSRAIGSRVTVEVTDRGVGITPEDLPHIFEKFRQGGDALRDKPDGSGLGLAICREIVEHHGGEIQVESEPGVGSTFRFTLPLRTAETRELGRPPLPAPVRAGELPRVLVVSSAPGTGRRLAGALRTLGFRAAAATGGEEATRHARREPPDLVVLDLLGPRDAHLAAVLRRAPETRHVPIVLTAVPEDPGAPRSGADAVLGRPLDPEELVRTVRDRLGQPPPRVAVLEADDRQRALLCAHLERSAMSALAFSCEEDLLAVAREAPVDLVIVGAGASEALLRSLRTAGPLADIPVILLAPPTLGGCSVLDGRTPEEVARAVQVVFERAPVAPETASTSAERG